MEEEMILNKKSNKKKVILLGMLLLIVIVGTVGVAYATYRFQTEGDSSTLVTGDIYMHYKGQNTGISIENGIPLKTYDPNTYFEFTIEGKNTYKEKDIWYEIDITDGDEPEGRTTRIEDKYLRFTLMEKIGTGKEKKILSAVSYDDITNKKIWVNKIDKNTNEEIKITYKLYMWISDEVHVGYDDEGEIEFDYSTDDWANNVYASVKVNVKGDFIEREIERPLPGDLPKSLSERIKALAYYREKEITAIDVTDKSNVKKCESIEECSGKTIEYRYMGPDANNYIYLKDNNEEDELWRIIGVFKDNTVGEYVKIVRDSILPESYLPKSFNGKTLKEDGTDTYWSNGNGSSGKADWSTAGLQYYLNGEQDNSSNKGFLSYLSENTKKHLVEVKYYLGSISPTWPTPSQAYKRERDVESCINNRSTTSEPAEGCYIWSGTTATWSGLVGLMYPSDYGLSSIETNWDKEMGNGKSRPNTFEEKEINSTTWMFNTISDAKNTQSWMISPVYDEEASAFLNDGQIYFRRAYHTYYPYSSSVRPVLSLSFSTTWLDGDGTKENPYKIIADKQ